MSLLLRDATLVPMDGPSDSPLGRVRTGSLRIEGERIAELGDLERRPGETVLDCSGLTLLPGFVQGHVHFCQTLFRGLADDLPLLEWLASRIWPLEAAHDAASTRTSAQLSVAELLGGGTTAVQVMESTRHAEETCEVLAHSPLTAIVGNCLMDVAIAGAEGLCTTPAEAMGICEELRREFHGRGGRLFYAVSPRFVLSLSEGLARDAADFAAEHDLRVHTHAAEHPDEVRAVRHRFGRDYIVALARQGLVGPRAGLAHCVHTTVADRDVMVESQCAVLHCPSANLKLGSGVAPVAAYRELGIRVALGADGAPCNNRLSALAEMRQAALLQAWAAGPASLPAEQALHMATRGGAEALGLQGELGSLRPGLRADLVALDLEAAGTGPGGGIASRVVYAGDERRIRHVLAGGRLCVRDGEYQLEDLGELAGRGRDQQSRLLSRAGLAS